VLDGKVLDRPRIEKVFDARGQPVLVDVDGRVPKIGAEADEPDDAGEYDDRCQRDREAMAPEKRTRGRG
jgi:hypothetical protein